MSTQSQNIEPRSIASGESVTWTKQLDAGLSGTLAYKLIGAGGMTLATVVQSGSFCTVSLSTVHDAGIYRLIGYVTKPDGSRLIVYDDTCEVTPNLIDATGAIDTRSYWQQLLDAIKAVSLDRATIHQRSMTTPGAGGRSIEYLSGEELYQWQKRCEYEIAREAERNRVKQGKSRRKVLIQFQ